jgi:hypothetical protein
MVFINLHIDYVLGARFCSTLFYELFLFHNSCYDVQSIDLPLYVICDAKLGLMSI